MQPKKRPAAEENRSKPKQVSVIKSTAGDGRSKPERESALASIKKLWELSRHLDVSAWMALYEVAYEAAGFLALMPVQVQKEIAANRTGWPVILRPSDSLNKRFLKQRLKGLGLGSRVHDPINWNARQTDAQRDIMILVTVVRSLELEFASLWRENERAYLSEAKETELDEKVEWERFEGLLHEYYRKKQQGIPASYGEMTEYAVRAALSELLSIGELKPADFSDPLKESILKLSNELDDNPRKYFDVAMKLLDHVTRDGYEHEKYGLIRKYGKARAVKHLDPKKRSLLRSGIREALLDGFDAVYSTRLEVEGKK